MHKLRDVMHWTTHFDKSKSNCYGIDKLPKLNNSKLRLQFGENTGQTPNIYDMRYDPDLHHHRQHILNSTYDVAMTTSDYWTLTDY